MTKSLLMATAALLVSTHIAGCGANTHPNADSGARDGDLDTDSPPEAGSDADHDSEEGESPISGTCQSAADVAGNRGCAPGQKCGLHSHDGFGLIVGCIPRLSEHEAEPFGRCQSMVDERLGLVDTCPAGFFCWDGSAISTPRCLKTCLSPRDEELRFSECSGARGTTSAGECVVDLEYPDLYGCLPEAECDLFCQDCAVGQRCQPSLAGQKWRHCVDVDRGDLPGEGLDGDPCFLRESCQDGYHCYTPITGVFGTCRAFCSIDGPSSCGHSACPEGSECQRPDRLDGLLAYHSRIFDGEQTLGLCLPN